MNRIVIRHLSGSKANQIETFPLPQTSELILGRDPSAAVRYDPERDDVVGRQHARTEIDRSNPAQFMLTDLNSRNGTFVNRQKITRTVRLHLGDVVQLGLGGPEFQFDIEPRPPEALKETRLADRTSAESASAPYNRTLDITLVGPKMVPILL
jgi:serine protease Do